MRLGPFGGLALVLAGCFSKPGFTGKPGDAGDDDVDVPPFTPLTRVNVSGNGLTDPILVTTEDVMLHFPMTGLRMPDQLQIGGREVLGATTQCGHENKIGLGVYPAYAATSDSTWPPGFAPSSVPTVNAHGPAFAQITIGWTGQFSCGAITPDPVASGTAMFTVFPDGRLVRNDRIAPINSGSIPQNVMCGCQSSPNYFLTTFLTVKAPEFSDLVYNAGSPAATMMMSPFSADVDDPNPRWACIEQPGVRRLGVAWPGSVTSGASDPQDGGTRVKVDLPAITFLFDWLYDKDTTPIPNTLVETSAAWFLAANARGTCDPTTMADLFTAYAAPRRLAVTADMMRNDFAALDPTSGIDRIPTQPSPASDFSVTVETGISGISGGFALSLPFATDVTPVVKLDGVKLVENRDFLAQHDLGTPVVHTLWFVNPLPQSHVLTLHQP